MLANKIKHGAAIACASLVLGSPAWAQDQSKPHSFRFYGHINPTILSVDDGQVTTTEIVDNANSGGRLGFWYEHSVNANTFRINGEISLGIRTSAGVSQLYTPQFIEWKGQSVRKFEAIWDTEKFGSISLGQGSMGSDGVTESDLSGTTLASSVGISDVAGGFFFRNQAGSLSSVRIKDAYPTFDGGRSQRLRYDSPEINFSRIGKLKFAASVGTESIDRNVTLNDALSDAGMFYRNQLGNFVLAGSAGVSIADVPTGTAPQIAGSFSVLHAPTGANITFASGSRDGGGSYVFSKVGFRGNWFNSGDTAISFDVYDSHDTVVSGSHARSYGIGVLQHLSRHNVDMFIGLRKYEYDGGGAIQYQDMYSAMIGVRWVFRRLQNRTIFEGLWQE
ncbi:porin [Shimia litoralis]|uniref:Porin n=1 Tax=Shimia litoralis TaxID=420403 RepID=A0A4U7N5I4_9RHOB|nr:porin [Shimia litoralis]TKZ20857.1 porin [Shimia litoralis]